jgi:hypothetical protein
MVNAAPQRGPAMDDAKILQTARAWALALSELRQARSRREEEGELVEPAELAIYSAAAHEAALRRAEQALFQACSTP